MSISLCAFHVKHGALYGLKELKKAIAKKDVLVEKTSWTSKEENEVLVAAGTTADLRIRNLLKSNNIEYPTKKESFLMTWVDTREGKVLVMAGADEAGLMYLLLEMARRVRVQGISALTEAVTYEEAPFNAVRCVDRYIVGHLDNEEWFWNEDFWHYFLQRLANGRYNRFCLIVGFDTSYMAPPYPFFLKGVPGYPDVKLNAFSPELAERNLEALNRVIELCHEYSIEFSFATWQQRPWTANQKTLVTGLPEDELEFSEYCYAGVKELLLNAPDIDIVSYRVNHESGVGTQVSAEDFWCRAIDAVADAQEILGKPFVMDIRAKGMTEKMTKHALERDLQLEVATKYWCEHAAMPHHITIMREEELAQLDNFNHSRRYSYADMLEKPMRYPVIYRLWNYGSTNLFLWGDADYARRFSKSCAFSGSSGFQINNPLALKYGYEHSHIKHWDTFKDPSLRSGKFEEERFFTWYTVYGRLGYNPDCEDVWTCEFTERYGEEAGVLLKETLETASKIVPFVTTFHMPQHPSLRYWVEMNTGFALFDENNIYEKEQYSPINRDKPLTYGSTEPSDHGLFYGIDEYAKAVLSGDLEGRYSPVQYSAELQRMAEKTLEGWEALSKMEVSDNQNEFRAALVDLKMLASFAQYHVNKILAAMSLAFYTETKDLTYLADTKYYFGLATENWKALSEDGLKYYYEDLDFSTAGTKTRRGTWNDLFRELNADWATLNEMMAEMPEAPTHTYAASAPAQFSGCFPETAKVGEAVTVSVKAENAADKTVVLRYRYTNQKAGKFLTAPMVQDGDTYTAEIPADYVDGKFDIQAYVTAEAADGTCTIYPGAYHPVYPFPWVVISVVK